jgi:branched chain amino acid efflux pump
MNDAIPHGAFIAILIMAFATLFTRVSGFWLMGHIPMTPRVRRGLEILPGAIMASAIIPIIAKVGIVALIAVGVALLSMIVKRNEFLAVGLALAAASLARVCGL